MTDKAIWVGTTYPNEGGKPVTIPNRFGNGILIVTMRGQGRTTLMKNIVLDQLRRRFHHNVVVSGHSLPLSYSDEKSKNYKYRRYFSMKEDFLKGDQIKLSI